MNEGAMGELHWGGGRGWGMGVSQTFRVERSDDRKNVRVRRLPQLRMAPITAVPQQREI